MDRTAFESHRIRDHLVETAGAALDRQGPAVVDVPTDVLRERPQVESDRPVPREPHRMSANEAELDRAVDVLEVSKRPAVVLGRGTRGRSGGLILRESGEIPVLTTAGSKEVVPASTEFCLPAARGDMITEADVFPFLGN